MCKQIQILIRGPSEENRKSIIFYQEVVWYPWVDILPLSKSH